MTRASPIGDQVLELFVAEEGQPNKRFTMRQIQEILDHIDPIGIKSAMERLRGQDGGIRRLRAVGYLMQSGNGGRAMPILELGTGPDVPRTDAYIEDPSAEVNRRARDIRRMQEDRRLQKELAAIDNYE
jgi:hypothetical protein